MKIAAVICEYNPFHHGHAYHLAETKEKTGCDYVIGIMSGNFVQRGEPAVLDKWARTEMALASGIDAIFELPCVYTLSSAQFFAEAGVCLAHRLGADYLSFGAESDLETIQKWARAKNNPAFSLHFREILSSGVSYAKAITDALEGIDGCRILPNDILGLEYVASIYKFNGCIQPVAVPRKYTNHDSGLISHGFASAKQIRCLLEKENDLKQVLSYMPETSGDVLVKWLQDETPICADSFDRLVVASVRSIGKEALDSMPFSEGGFGHLVFNAALTETTIEGIVKACTSLRYPSSRIRRYLFQTLLGIRKKLCILPVPYARLLGFKKTCGCLIGEIEKRSKIPLVKSVAKVRNHLTEYDDVFKDVLMTDLRAQDLYSLVLSSPERQKGGRDYTTPMVIV